MTAVQPQSDLDRPVRRGLPPMVLARIRAEKLFRDPLDRERFMDLVRGFRALIPEGWDSSDEFARSWRSGDSVLIAALVEAESSLRTGPLVP